MTRVWRNDIEIGRMSLEIADNVRADRYNFQPTRPRIIQCEANNLASNAASFERRWNLRVYESDLLAAIELIL